MGVEIERKFLVHRDTWNALEKPKPNYLMQGYLHSDADKTIRVRASDDKGFITIKGKSSADGLVRSEYEYEIPKMEAVALLANFTDAVIEKYRYEIFFAGKVWEVDVFEGENAGLIVAELELDSMEEKFEVPNWVSEEVTGDVKYFNSFLITNPFRKW
jgi:CYTH domain-containing protein